MNYDPYPIRFRPDERVMLKELARQFERRESETVRMLVRGMHEIMKEQDRLARPGLTGKQPARKPTGKPTG